MQSVRDHVGVQLQVSNWTSVIGYPGDSHVNYASFNAFLLFLLFPTVLRTYEKRYRHFCQKELPIRQYDYRYD